MKEISAELLARQFLGSCFQYKIMQKVCVTAISLSVCGYCSNMMPQ